MQQKINLNQNNKKATITIKLNKNLNGIRKKVNLSKKHIPTTTIKRRFTKTTQNNYYDNSYEDELDDEYLDEREDIYDETNDKIYEQSEQAKEKIVDKVKEKIEDKVKEKIVDKVKEKIEDKAKEEVVDTTVESGATAGVGTGATTIGIVTLVMLIILIIIILIILIYYKINEDSSYGSFKYGKTCPTVTVIDTDCDMHAKNCTHKYDGEIELEDYVAGVVAAEVGVAHNLEFYKVAAILARTYFLSHTNSNCTIKGNATRQAYMDVNDSWDATLIKQAVEETKSLVLVKNNDLAPTYYASACVVNADDNYYYVRYGTKSIGKANFQSIPKEWDSDRTQGFHGYLAEWYSMVDKSNTNYETKSCPNNHDMGMSQVGGLYLAKSENYNYEEIINYYFGDETEIMTNGIQLSGVDGFINPTRIIACNGPLSAFGMRMHPVYNEWRMHNGIDLGSMPEGEPIYAVKDGIVTYVCKSAISGVTACGSGGNNVVIDHGDGTKTIYMHMSYGTIPDTIYAGAKVSQGEQIGGVGTTGTSTGFHLHYAVLVNGEYVNPADYIDWTNGIDKGNCRKL